VIIILSIKIEN